jgi:hypothetical protein
MVVVQESGWFWRTLPKSLLIAILCSGVMMVLCALHHHDAICCMYIDVDTLVVTTCRYCVSVTCLLTFRDASRITLVTVFHVKTGHSETLSISLRCAPDVLLYITKK